MHKDDGKMKQPEKIMNFHVRIREWGELRAEVCYWDGVLQVEQQNEDYFPMNPDLSDILWFFRSRLGHDAKMANLSTNEVIEHLKISKGKLMIDHMQLIFLKRKLKSPN